MLARPWSSKWSRSMSRSKNAVVSHKGAYRKRPLRAARSDHRQPRKGQVLEGLVKNITDFGAFSTWWRRWYRFTSPTSPATLRISHPSRSTLAQPEDQRRGARFRRKQKRIRSTFKQLQPIRGKFSSEEIKEGLSLKQASSTSKTMVHSWKYSRC